MSDRLLSDEEIATIKRAHSGRGRYSIIYHKYDAEHAIRDAQDAKSYPLGVEAGRREADLIYFMESWVKEYERVNGDGKASAFLEWVYGIKNREQGVTDGS